MRAYTWLGVGATLLTFITVAGCSPAATEAPAQVLTAAPAAEAPTEVEREAVAEAEPEVPAAEQPPVIGTSIPAGAVEAASGVLGAATERMIIKDAQVRLLVQDTDVAIDRLTQVVGDVGGYIVSSRLWYQEHGEESYKYATVTMGVPVDEFERALRRLRELAVKVLDESASGEDVTDQYVDLESRVRNLEATRDRIRTFLEQAATVDEALQVNEQLAEIEAQIEQVQGRLRYLAGRAAYSTITVQLEPDLPILAPTPTPTPAPTPTPTPIVWEPGKTFRDASRALNAGARSLADVAIWIAVTVLPCVVPLGLIGWGIWRLVRRRRQKREKAPPAPQPES